MEQPEVRLARGLARLRIQPGNWADAVDPTTLEMWDADTCVLGQMYGSFNAGKAALGLDNDGAFHHGFGLPNDYWLPEILKRRTEAA